MVLNKMGLEDITNMFVPDQGKFEEIIKEVTTTYGKFLEPLKTAFDKPDPTDKSKAHYYLFKQQSAADEKRELNDRFNAWLIGDGEKAKYSVLRLIFITLSFIYMPLCAYIVTRKGYSVGGTDLNDFPYSDNKTSGSRMLKEFSETYKQLGGKRQKGGASGVGPGYIYGPYRSVQFPYTLTAKSYTDYNAFIFFMLWIVESVAGSYCFGRQLLDAMIGMFKAMGVGFDPSKSSNQRMLSFAKCFLAAIPFMSIIPIITALLPIFNIIQLVVRIPNRLWPFVGNRTFSTIFIFIILAITVIGLMSYITVLTTTLTVVSTLLTTIQVLSYSLFFFLAPLFLAGSRDNIYMSAILGPVLKVYLIVLITLVIILPTNAEFGQEAMIGGLIALFSSGGIAYYNSNKPTNP
tara:strand:- start:564 stop:1778 length:1215 start_codon:yes stop_codon:yes gene_type:complete